jgi:hypothetical protein
MSSSVIGASSIALLLEALESHRAVLSGATLQRFPKEAAALKSASLIMSQGHEPVTSSRTDHSDRPIALTWEASSGTYGYFSETDGWIAVATEEIEPWSIDFPRFLSAVAAKLDLERQPPRPLVDDFCWELGLVRVGGRIKRLPLLFGRRLHDANVWAQVEQVLRRQPRPGRPILLTSTNANRLPKAPSGLLIAAIADLLCAKPDIAIPPQMLAVRLDDIPVIDPDEVLLVLADGKEVRLRGEVFRFPKAPKQRSVIRYLYERYVEGEFWISSDQVVTDLDFDPRTRIRDIFRKSRAWNRLLTERDGMLGFCIESAPAPATKGQG